MKAVICPKYGPPDVLQLKDVGRPIPKVNEVLIKIHKATVNRTDCAALRADPFIWRFTSGLLRPKRQITGYEFAGNIESVGEDVTSFKVGDKVFGFNEGGMGAHAEYMVIADNKALITMPDNLTYEQAAASVEGAHYAYNIINKVNMKNDHIVLINGASGGIGSAAVQLVKYFGAKVTAVCDTKNIELIKSLGADEIIDYTKEDFTKGGRKYNFVFDTVGKSSFSKCKPLLFDGGVYISSELGYMAQNIFFALISAIKTGKKVKFPIPTDMKRSLRFIKKLIVEGKYKAVIDRKYPLEQIIDAFKYVESGQKTGNVVITVNHTKK